MGAPHQRLAPGAEALGIAHPSVIIHHIMADYDNYIPRDLSVRLGRCLSYMPVVVVTGMRQTGKTTLLQHDPTCRGRRYLTLDDFATLEAARHNPEALVSDSGALTIDEVQRCPELLVAIKRKVDANREPGRFLLSGSANLSLLKGVSESLAGRAVHLRLEPFSLREATRATHRRPFLLDFLERSKLPGQAVASRPVTDAEVLAGGMPPVHGRPPEVADTWLSGYEQTYLERDLRDLARVADLAGFRRLLHLVAHRTGSILNQSDLARDAHLPPSTVSRYLGLLEVSFVARRVPPFLRNRQSRLVKSPKIFMADSGLAAFLMGVRELDSRSEPFVRGPLFETFVAQNLLSLMASHAPRYEVSFWHVQGRYEVDFVVAQPRSSIAIEVKAATRFDGRDLKGLRALMGSSGVQAAVLGYNGVEAVQLDDRLFAIPLFQLLS